MKKRVFIFLAVVALALNIGSDVSVYTQNNELLKTGDWVSDAHDFLHTLSDLKIALLRSQLEQSVAPEWATNIKTLNDVARKMGADTNAVRELTAFNAEDLLRKDDHRAYNLLGLMHESALSTLRLRETADEQSNSGSIGRILFSNLVDLALVALFIVFYVNERRESQRLQTSMRVINSQLETVNLSLQTTLNQRNAHFRSAVHDLKNPLGSILGMAELMFDEAGDKNSVLEMSEIIQKVSESTLLLVSSVLETEKDSLNESVDVVDCLRETCVSMQSVAAGKNQSIEFSAPSDISIVAMPKPQIQSVFFNLIGNALKFSPAGTTVRVKCTTKSNIFSVEVFDQGPGFTPSDLEKLFIEGVSLSAKPTGSEISTGIGLSSVKRTIESVRGQIEISNNDDGGACARVQLPLAS